MWLLVSQQESLFPSWNFRDCFPVFIYFKWQGCLASAISQDGSCHKGISRGAFWMLISAGPLTFLGLSWHYQLHIHKEGLGSTNQITEQATFHIGPTASNIFQAVSFYLVSLFSIDLLSYLFQMKILDWVHVLVFSLSIPMQNLLLVFYIHSLVSSK